jgi:pantoate kinase
MLADGTFFPLGCCVVPWGCAGAPAGVALEALRERGCSCKVFSQRLPVCEVLVSAGIGDVSAGFSGAMRTYRHLFAFGAYPRGVAVRRAPEPGPI